MTLKLFFPLICYIAVLMITTQAQGTIDPQNYKPANGFQSSGLLGTWYSIFYADTKPEYLTACDRQIYTAGDDGTIIKQLGYYIPGLEGDYDSILVNLTEASEGKFAQGGNTPEGSYVFVLDYDSNFDWIVLADNYNFGGAISAISKTPDNDEAISRAIELCEKYGKNSHHLIWQTPKCEERNILKMLDEERVQGSASKTF